MLRPMSAHFPVYVFRDRGFAPGGETVVCAAPLDFVVSVYGGGGLNGEGGLAGAFGGAAFFRNDETGSSYFGVLGRTKRFALPERSSPQCIAGHATRAASGAARLVSDKRAPLIGTTRRISCGPDVGRKPRRVAIGSKVAISIR